MPMEGPVQRQLDAYNAHDLEAFLACYATEVVVRHGSGEVMMTGHEQLRTDYGRLFEQQPDVRAVVVNRIEAGEWVVDEEHVAMKGRELRALVAYRVDGDVIRDVVMMTSDPHVLEPGHARTPFTAEEIRTGCPAGRTIRMRVEAAGEPATYRVSRFVECDDTGALAERYAATDDGTPLGDRQSGRVTWRDLQAHASFPADRTTIEPEQIETPIGTLDCLRYTVRDGATEEVFWFAAALPGMPVRYLTRADGRVVASTSVVANTLP